MTDTNLSPRTASPPDSLLIDKPLAPALVNGLSADLIDDA